MRRIAGRAGELCGEGDCVLIYGECGVVRAMLGVAAGENGPMGASGARLSRPRFRVVYLQRGSDGPEAGKRSPTVTMLRRLGVPVAVIGFEALGEVLRECSHVLLGAEVVTATGGIVGRFGTKVVVELATLYRKDVYVLAESFRFVRVTPVGLGDLGLEQRVLDFRVDEDGEDDGEEAGGKGKGKGKGRGKGKGMEKMGMGVDTKQGQRNGVEEILVDNRQISEADWVDFTPAKYIKAIVTELQGPKDLMPPSGVFEQLMKIWMY